jgi:hypothetical protein
MMYAPHMPHRWEPWYAWYPVVVGGDRLFWLEFVWRRKRLKGGWNYRTFRSLLEEQVAVMSLPIYEGF